MRINRLDLLAFGPFTNVVLELEDAEHDLHLVYGPNEAGKSSALRAIFAWLFGIPTRSVDNFVHEYKAMRVGGELQNADGNKLLFVRRKGKKNDLLAPEGNVALPASSLEPFVGGMDAETFERIWGIDHRRLIEGGSELQSLKGLAGESLFAAAMGIRNLSQVLTGLHSDSQRIFVPDRRAGTEIRSLKRRFDEAGKNRREAEVSVNAWTKMQKDLKAAKGHERELGERLRELRAETNRLSRIRSVLGEVGELNALRAELSEMDTVQVLPPDYSAEDRLRTQHALANIDKQIDEAKRDLDGPDGLIPRRAAIDVDERILEEEATIEQLLKKAGAYQKACDDLPKRQGEKRLLAEQAACLLGEIDASLDWKGAEKLRVSQVLEAEITRLGQQQGRLMQNLDGQRQQMAELEREIHQARNALAAIPQPADVTSLRRAAKKAAKQGDLQQLAADKAAQAHRLTEQAEDEIRRLGHWQGTVREVPVVRLPLRSTVEKYAERFRRLDEEKTQIERTVIDHRRDLEKLDQEIENVQRKRQVPPRSKLSELRHRRDQGWQLVRRVWLDRDPAREEVARFAGDHPLDRAYEASVKEVDNTAERLIDESELSAKLEQKRERCAVLRVSLEQQQELRKAWEPRRKSLCEEWEALWTEQGVDDPLSPREMAEWLDAFGDLRNLVEQIEGHREDAAGYERTMAEHVRVLGDHLSQLGEPYGSATARFDDMLARCQELIDLAVEREQLRANLIHGLAEKETKLEALKHGVASARTQLDQWQRAWTDAVGELGCSEGCSVERANVRLRVIREYFAKRDAISDLDAKRIEPMLEDRQRFERDVAHLIERCARDLSDLEPAAAADALAKRLKRAVQATQARANFDEQISEKRRQAQRLVRERESAERRLEQLCQLASVDDPDALMGVEAASQRKRDVIARLSEIERRLLREGEGAAVDDLIKEAVGASRDEIDAAMTELEEKMENQDAERVQLIRTINDLQRQSDAVDGGARAAVADQEALGCATQAAELAQRYARLRLAANLLRRRIDKHRTENQDPMIVRSSEIFARLTCGSFVGLTLDYDEKEQPTIVGLRDDDDTRLPVEAFSRGTADQLYLSLRLAYLQARLDAGEPMPIILDDLLVDFDDRRAAAALEVLADLSKQTQIILLTHHHHLRELARRTLGAGTFREHCLSAAQ